MAKKPASKPAAARAKKPVAAKPVVAKSQARGEEGARRGTGRRARPAAHDVSPRSRSRAPAGLRSAIRRSSFAVVLAALLFQVGCSAFGRAGAEWWNLRRDPSGQAPDPASTREPVVQVYAARTVGWRGVLAVHTWIAFKPRGAAEYTRYEVIGWGVDRGAPAVRVNRTGPDNYWFGSRPDLLADRRGDGVDAIIAKVEAAVAAYPYPASYRTWPGPNSNTFIAYVARAVPELRLDLPPTAIGKDYLPGAALVGLEPERHGRADLRPRAARRARGLGGGPRDQPARPHLRGRREEPCAQDSRRRPRRTALTRLAPAPASGASG